MKKGSHFNATFVTTNFLSRVTSKDTLNQFMNEETLSNVAFVTKFVGSSQNGTLKRHLESVHEKRNYSNRLCKQTIKR